MPIQHLVGLVGKSVYQHRDVQPRHADGVGHTALVTEVGQADQNAIDLVAVLREEVSAPARVLQGFHRAKLGFLGGQADRPVALLFQLSQDFNAAVARQHGGEKPRSPMITPKQAVAMRFLQTGALHRSLPLAGQRAGRGRAKPRHQPAGAAASS
ncbi:MAG TPA: hypothetical protein VKM93_02800 [Terriglobia bacterium]|nr:hypothetical protein [Terriglobia bacterium]